MESDSSKPPGRMRQGRCTARNVSPAGEAAFGAMSAAAGSWRLAQHSRRPPSKFGSRQSCAAPRAVAVAAARRRLAACCCIGQPWLLAVCGIRHQCARLHMHCSGHACSAAGRVRRQLQPAAGSSSSSRAAEGNNDVEQPHWTHSSVFLLLPFCHLRSLALMRLLHCPPHLCYPSMPSPARRG